MITDTLFGEKNDGLQSIMGSPLTWFLGGMHGLDAGEIGPLRPSVWT